MDGRNNNSLSLSDLSKSNFRGSGAIYQTDRLTVGRSPNKFLLEGKQQIVEKVIYKDNEETVKRADILSTKLKESMLRLLVVSAEHERMAKQLNDSVNQAGVFQTQTTYNNQKTKSELQRVTQLLKEKEKELHAMRTTESNKPGAEQRDLTLRLKIMGEENKRLQTLITQRSMEVATLNSQVLEVREHPLKISNNHSSDLEVSILRRQLGERGQEIENYKSKVNLLEQNAQAKSIHSTEDLKQATIQTEELKRKLEEVNRSKLVVKDELIAMNGRVEEEIRQKEQLKIVSLEL